MKTLALRIWNEERAALAVLAGAGMALAELLIGDGLTTSDIPTILAMMAAGAAGKLPK